MNKSKLLIIPCFPSERFQNIRHLKTQWWYFMTVNTYWKLKLAGTYNSWTKPHNPHELVLLLPPVFKKTWGLERFQGCADVIVWEPGQMGIRSQQSAYTLKVCKNWIWGHTWSPPWTGAPLSVSVFISPGTQPNSRVHTLSIPLRSGHTVQWWMTM